MARKFDVGRAALSANCTADLTWVKQDLLGRIGARRDDLKRQRRGVGPFVDSASE
jgi:hypothetical protein